MKAIVNRVIALVAALVVAALVVAGASVVFDAGVADFSAGLALGPEGVVAAYGDVLDGIVSDEPLEGSPVPVLVTDTLMADAAGRERVATETLEFARSLSSAQPHGGADRR